MSNLLERLDNLGITYNNMYSTLRVAYCSKFDSYSNQGFWCVLYKGRTYPFNTKFAAKRAYSNHNKGDNSVERLPYYWEQWAELPDPGR